MTSQTAFSGRVSPYQLIVLGWRGTAGNVETRKTEATNVPLTHSKTHRQADLVCRWGAVRRSCGAHLEVDFEQHGAVGGG